MYVGSPTDGKTIRGFDSMGVYSSTTWFLRKRKEKEKKEMETETEKRKKGKRGRKERCVRREQIAKLPKTDLRRGPYSQKSSDTAESDFERSGPCDSA